MPKMLHQSLDEENHHIQERFLKKFTPSQDANAQRRGALGRRASFWTAPVLWRFSAEVGQRGRLVVRRLPKAAQQRPHSKTLTRSVEGFSEGAAAFGLRQSSGALQRRLGSGVGSTCGASRKRRSSGRTPRR